MSKHTPGPWRAGYTKLTDVVAENGALIATCHKLKGLVELQANARLIAAAPTLLAAIKSQIEAFDGDSISDILVEYGTGTARRVEIAREAIAEATGEPQ